VWSLLVIHVLSLRLFFLRSDLGVSVNDSEMFGDATFDTNLSSSPSFDFSSTNQIMTNKQILNLITLIVFENQFCSLIIYSYAFFKNANRILY